MLRDPAPPPPTESPRTPRTSTATATADSPTRAAVRAARQTLDAAGRQLAALVDGGMEQLARVTELATTHVTRQGQRAAVAASAAVQQLTEEGASHLRATASQAQAAQQVVTA